MMISVIIPLHDSTRYLPGLFSMLEGQTFSDFEALFIDDGSDDHPETYFTENNDGRMRLLFCDGGGVSQARNLGLKESRGDHIAFIDADDEITDDYLESLLRAITVDGADMAMCGFEEIYADHRREVLYDLRPFYEGKEDLIDEVLIPILKPFCPYPFATAVWGKLIKRTCIEDDVFFPPDIRIGEDHLFLMRLFHHLNSLSYVRRPLYHYIRHKSSALNSTEKRDEDGDLFLRLYEEELEKSGISTDRVNYDLYVKEHHRSQMKRAISRGDYDDFMRMRKIFLEDKLSSSSKDAVMKRYEFLNLLLRLSPHLYYKIMRHHLKKYESSLLS